MRTMNIIVVVVLATLILHALDNRLDQELSRIINEQKKELACKIDEQELLTLTRQHLTRQNITYNDVAKTFDASRSIVSALTALVDGRGGKDDIYREFALEGRGIGKETWEFYAKNYATKEKIAALEKTIPADENAFVKQLSDSFRPTLEGKNLAQKILEDYDKKHENHANASNMDKLKMWWDEKLATRIKDKEYRSMLCRQLALKNLYHIEAAISMTSGGHGDFSFLKSSERSEKQFEYSMPIVLLPILRALRAMEDDKPKVENVRYPLIANLTIEVEEKPDDDTDNTITKRIILKDDACGATSILTIKNGMVMEIHQSGSFEPVSYVQTCEKRLAPIHFLDAEYEKLYEDALRTMFRNECPFVALPTGKFSAKLEAMDNNSKDSFQGIVTIKEPTFVQYRFSLSPDGWLYHSSIKRGGNELKYLAFSVTIPEENYVSLMSVRNPDDNSSIEAHFYRNHGLKAYIVNNGNRVEPVQIWNEGGTDKKTMTIEQLQHNPAVLGDMPGVPIQLK